MLYSGDSRTGARDVAGTGDDGSREVGRSCKTFTRCDWKPSEDFQQLKDLF